MFRPGEALPPRQEAAWRPLRWLLPLVFVLAYLVPLGARPLTIPDEARYAEISREMVASGDWIVPRLLGLRYFEKPAGGYWLNNLSLALLGNGAFAIRLPTALAAGASALLVGWLARRGTRDARKGWLAAAITLTSYGMASIGTYAVLDMLLATWLTAASCAFWVAYEARSVRRRALGWSAFGAACGAAFLTKGFVALAVPLVAIAPFLLLQRRGQELLRWGAWSVLVAVAVALPWSLAIHALEPDFWERFFWNEHVRRFGAEDAQHGQPFWYYVPVLVALLLPWTAALPGALLSGARRSWWNRDPFARYLTCAWLAPLLLFSLARGKLATYVLPCHGPLAILLASWLVDQVDRRRRAALAAVAWTNLALAVAALLGLLAVELLGHDRGRILELGSALPLGVVLGLWLALAVATVRGRVACPTGLCGTLVLLGSVPLLARPGTELARTMPQEALRECARRLDPDVALASASVALDPLLAWVFERTDVLIVGGSGELTFGRKHPDAAGRWVPDEEFPAWLAAERARRTVALFVRDAEDAERYPVPDRLETLGPVSVLVYEKRPE